MGKLLILGVFFCVFHARKNTGLITIWQDVLRRRDTHELTRSVFYRKRRIPPVSYTYENFGKGIIFANLGNRFFSSSSGEGVREECGVVQVLPAAVLLFA